MALHRFHFHLPVWAKTLIKIVVLGIIIFLIIRKIDEKLLIKVMKEIPITWILWGMLWFAISKFLASFRFNTLLRTEGVWLSTLENIKIYWMCMYYNLLLPGGISGDGYKIKILMDRFQVSFKRLLTITLIDRISGVMALGQLALVLVFFIPALHPYRFWMIPALVLSLITTWLIYRWFRLTPALFINTLQSLGVQSAQVIAVMGLVVALRQEAQWPDYIILFLISSIVAMVPMTIGGAGAREITFLYGSKYLAIDPEKAVAIAFLFYILSTFVSFLGILFSLKHPTERVTEL